MRSALGRTTITLQPVSFKKLKEERWLIALSRTAQFSAGRLDLYIYRKRLNKVSVKSPSDSRYKHEFKPRRTKR
ncbi:hypothetical protein G5714_001460 [Onychostoma macrolepis]|uniref:Uncharacterized protein n=1 Tax=Onychostoma macrolepis TaxID=369639 RepID=A0A7J6DC67_9TELE|nr:hypothetical protein G5714_001460 [Onychostoma macrolepis]